MKNKLLIAGLTLATMAALFAVKPSINVESLIESTESTVSTVEAISLRKVASGEQATISETYAQWGKNEETGRLVLRFATAVSGDIKSATYTRAALRDKEANVKTVSVVYAGIETEQGVAYYTAEGLTYNKPETLTHYWACYTIEYSENSIYRAEDINVELSVESRDGETLTANRNTSINALLENSGVYKLLPKRTNSETHNNRDSWGYNNPNNSAKYDIAPCEEFGKIIMGLSANNFVSSDHELRFQPKGDVGSNVKVTAKVTYEGNGYFLYGNDYKNSKDIKKDENGFYNLVWNGQIKENAPFKFIFRSNDSFATALKIVVHEFSYEVENYDETAYLLSKKTNSEICANPGVWGYTAPTGAKFDIAAKFSKDGLVWGLSAENVSGDYQLRYQPNLAVDASYKVTAKVLFEGNGYFLYGNDYKSSKNLTPNEDGSYSISWTGKVSSTPFYFVMKSNDTFATALKITVTNIVITAN